MPLFIGLGASTEACAESTIKLTAQQLDSLTAPIALYPDALLAQVLMATTFPQEVQAAAQWSKAHSVQNGDDAVKAVSSQPWDPSVQSLVAFPQVLATMASRPEWVTQIGDAFLAQPNDVMNSVQRLRKQAQEAGNLKSNQQQNVIVEQDKIQIQPANPQVVYVPTYNPTLVYGSWPYPAYPPIYIPPPPGYAIATGFAAGLAFGAGIAVTNSLWGGVNWNTGNVNVNVNRFNNINVNNRLNASGDTANWNRNANYNRDSLSFNKSQLDSYRGYDQSRQQAMQTLEHRTGESFGGSANQRLQDIHEGGFDPNDLSSRADFANRDNALRGAGDGDAARQDMQRGEASRNAFASDFGGDRFGGGGFGGGDRFGGGGGGGRGFGGGFGGGRRFRRRMAPLSASTPDCRRDRTIIGRSIPAALPSLGRKLALKTSAIAALLVCMVLLLGIANAHAQAAYPSPDTAANALVDALSSNDQSSMKHVLGNHFQRFIPSQNVGADDIYDFLGAWAQGHEIVNDPPSTDGKQHAHLLVGKSNWTLPIPLVQTSAGWRFDPGASREEMQLRRVGRNERAAMLASLAYVEAQKDYRNLTGHYALRLISTPGKRDGLYWAVAPGEPQSPLGPLAAAMPGGNVISKEGYHGYYYRILIAQGANAKGGALNYVQNGAMTDGYALVAWPAQYGMTGVMTFLVNQDGDLFEKNLGLQTARIAAGFKLFNPDKTWSQVQP
jgi:hypothetical protein